MKKKKAGRKSLRPPKEQFEALYKVMKASEVAEHFGVSTATVYQWSMYFRNKGGEIKEPNEKSLLDAVASPISPSVLQDR